MSKENMQVMAGDAKVAEEGNKRLAGFKSILSCLTCCCCCCPCSNLYTTVKTT